MPKEDIDRPDQRREQEPGLPIMQKWNSYVYGLMQWSTEEFGVRVDEPEDPAPDAWTHHPPPPNPSSGHCEVTDANGVELWQRNSAPIGGREEARSPYNFE